MWIYDKRDERIPETQEEKEEIKKVFIEKGKI